MTSRIAVAAALCAAVGCGHAAPRGAAPPAPVPETTGVIAGVVRDRASQETLSFATVNATPAGAEVRAAEHTETTSARGEFAIRGLPPGTYVVNVYYANVSVRWQTVDVTAGGTVDLDIDISLEQAATTPFAADTDASDAPTQADHGGTRKRGNITGEVVDEKTGEKLEGAVVAATSPHLRDAQLAVTDETGTYRIIGVPPGTYKLSVYYRLVDYGYIEVQRNNVQVSGGQTTTVPLKLDTNVQAEH